jgi:hypothetical protein
MSNVIDFYKWKSERREQLGCDPVRAYQRHSRRDRREGSKPTATGLE